MKKFISIILFTTMIFSLLNFSLAIASTTAVADEDVGDNSDSDMAVCVMDKINEIGTINFYSGNRIREAREFYEELSDSQKELVENLDILISAENEIAGIYYDVANIDHRTIFEETGDYIECLGTPDVGSTGGEWMVIDLTRSGRNCPQGYYENVVNYIDRNINENEQLHRSKSTENSRVILALTSAGYDVTNVNGHNLLVGLSDMNYLKKQGLNGPIWALIAFDSYAYEIPENQNAQTQATREDIISYILQKQLPDGGWSIFGNAADPDMTGMAIQALAPYYHSNPDVESCINFALECLSDIQYENGGYGSIEGICSESCAQVIVALTSLGINPEEDERFIKNGVSVVDSMCALAVDGGGFEHIPYGGINGMATEQSQYALASYFRLLEGKSSLYDMTDVSIYTDETFEDAYDDEYTGEDEIIEDAYDDEYTEENEAFEDYESDDTKSESDSDELQNSDSINESESSEKNKDIIEEVEESGINPLTEDRFNDVKSQDWYYDGIKYVYENNLMQGMDEISFAPHEKMSRAMLVTVLFRMSNSNVLEATHNFLDVPYGQWYYDAVSWASQNNIISGVGENKFMPDEAVTREQMALIIYRYAKLQGVDIADVSDLDGYTDINDVSDWAFNAVGWANSVMLINGTTETTLSPKDTATRAQVATILMRFSETVSK